MDVGQADATLLQFADEGKMRNILYDTGDWNRTDVIDYLHQQQVTNLDLLIISHPDADHIGQMAKIMQSLDVGEVWMTGNENASNTFQKAIEAVLDSDATYEEPRAGDQFDIGPLAIEVVHPKKITGKANEESLSVKFTYGELSFLFTGDAGKADEQEMIDRKHNLHATILQLGHHGSDTSTSTAFLQAVKPEVAIYSAGADNTYGHPHQEVLSRLQKADIPVYGTDESGNIIVTTDGKNYTLETEKDQDPSKEVNGNQDCIDLNQATAEALQQIVHIGKARAQDIIKERPYHSIDDLLQVDGIGEKRLNEIKQEGKACIGGK